jgi:hypothetical protein
VDNFKNDDFKNNGDGNADKQDGNIERAGKLKKRDYVKDMPKQETRKAEPEKKQDVDPYKEDVARAPKNKGQHDGPKNFFRAEDVHCQKYGHKEAFGYRLKKTLFKKERNKMYNRNCRENN